MAKAAFPEVHRIVADADLDGAADPDVDGDGNLDRSSDPYGPNFLINSWVLFSW